MKHRMLTIILALCLVCALFAGCSDTTSGTPTPTATPSSSVPDDTSNPTDTVNEEDKYGGTLYIYAGTTTDITFYFPEFTRSTNIYAPACETLGIVDNEGNISGRLVDGFEVDPDALTLTMTCREGITFSDGSEFNAEALAWEINECINENNTAVSAGASSAEAVDDMTVVVHFPSYANNWAEIYSQFIVISKYSYDTYGKDYMINTPVGTGPFICTNFEKNVTVEFKRNENYWQEGLPYLDGITFVCMSQETLLSSMVNNEIQVVNSSDGSVVDQLISYCGDNIKNITENEAAGTMYTYFTVNSLDPNSPFADVLVRRACFYALDNDALAAVLAGDIGYGANQHVAKGSLPYLEEDELYADYTYNVEKAKELLAEAGYPNGFDCTIMARSSNEKQSVALQSYLKAVGINAEIEMVDSSIFTERTTQNGTCDLAILTAGPRSLNWTSSWEKHLSAKRSRFLTVQADFPEFDELFMKTQASTTQEELIETQKACNYWLNENVPQVPMFFSNNVYYSSANLMDSHMGGNWYQWTPETAYFA